MLTSWTLSPNSYFSVLTFRVTRLRLSTNITLGDGTTQITEASAKGELETDGIPRVIVFCGPDHGSNMNQSPPP